jgi:SAM-dependent methyltransferase
MTGRANARMVAAWDGDEGSEWARDWVRYDRAVAGYETILRGSVGVGPGDQVLDVGCGVGESARAAARAAGPDGAVVGIDLSSMMIARGADIARAEGLSHLELVTGDAQVGDLGIGRFDVVQSRFGAMFFDDPVAAFTNIGRAMRVGGRLVLLGWRRAADNEWLGAVLGALAVDRRLAPPPVGEPGPFGLADPVRNDDVLSAAGFALVEHHAVDAPFRLGHDAADAFEWFHRTGIVRGMTAELDEADRARAMERLHRTIVDHDTGHGVLFGSGAWLVTARRA